MTARGFRVGNCDLTLIAEAPRIAPHREAIVANIAADLGIARDRVNVKATTAEGLGAIGRGEGLAAQAVVLLLDAHAALIPPPIPGAGSRSRRRAPLARRRYPGHCASRRPTSASRSDSASSPTAAPRTGCSWSRK